MPIARGPMQMGRINVFPTTTTLVSINPPDIGFCGDSIIFTVTVSNNRGAGFPVPTGTVLIKDSVTNTTLASGPLVVGVSFSTATINTTIAISNNQIYAQYVGVVNQFGTSESASVPYSVSLVGTVTTITTSVNSNFCFHNNFNLSVRVARATPSTTISSLSNGAILPQSTINVASTSGFQSSGTILVVSSFGGQTINYTGITSTSFTGCTGAAGTILTGNLVGIAVSSGSVQVNLYSDAVSFITIGTASLNGVGSATVVLPANTTVPGNTYYIQAKYLGAGCAGVSNSPLGTGGTPIHSYSLTQNSTTTVAGISGSSTFCIHSPINIFAFTTSAFLGFPTVGSVTWTAVKSPNPPITLGTDSSFSSGSTGITVPGDTFTSTGTWTVTAAYTGDGYCFANSSSLGFSVTPSIFAVDIFLHAGPTSFCRATQQIFEYDVLSSFAGTINGTFVLKSSFGTTLKTITVSGPHTGFVIQFIVPANTALSGVQNVFVQFTPAGGSCYAAETGSNLGVTVSANPPQTPSSTVLAVTNSTTGDGTPPISGDDNDTYTFSIIINKVSKIGPLDGAGSLNGSATLELFDTGLGAFYVYNNNIHIFDSGTFGYGSLVVTGGLPSTTTSARIKWNGNACYGQQFSNFVAMSIIHIIS